MPDSYDLIVLGAGTGGYAAAIRASSLGKKVALIERDKVGGTCLHRGCIPTKALLHSAGVMDTVRDAGRFGIQAGEPTYDWQGVQAHKDRVVTKMWKGLQGLIKHRGIDTVQGTGSFKDSSTIEVEGRELTAPNLVIATGSVPKMIPGLERGPRVLTSDEALVEGVPRSAIVLGGGSVGVEFASVYHSMGAQVTVVEMLPTLVPLEDEALGKELARTFTKRGIRCMTGAKLEEAKVGEDSVQATITVDGKTETIEADVLLCAVGRGPVTDEARFDAAGVDVDERGFVPVDEYGRTNVPHIFAVGDVIKTPALAHVAFAEGMLVAEFIAGENPAPINYDAIPRATYSAPEVAAVGLTEAQARDRGHDVVTKSVPFSAIGRATILGENAGFCKIVAERDGRILGVHFIGPHVTELVAEAMLAMGWEAMPDEVAQLIHPHPTLSESFGEAALSMAGRALHTT